MVSAQSRFHEGARQRTEDRGQRTVGLRLRRILPMDSPPPLRGGGEGRRLRMSRPSPAFQTKVYDDERDNSCFHRIPYTERYCVKSGRRLY
jgi:hypothetical protein